MNKKIFYLLFVCCSFSLNILYAQMQWHPIRNFEKTITFIKEINNQLYVGVFGDGVYTSSDGLSWELCANSIGHYPYDLLKVEDNLMLSSGDLGIMTKPINDCNADWQNIQNEVSGHKIYKLIFSNNNIYAATNKGLYVSSNNGVNWTKINVPRSATPEDVFDCAFMDNKLICVTQGFVNFSVDNGVSWDIDTLPKSYVQNKILINGSNLFLLSSGDGVYKYQSNDNWIPFYTEQRNNVGENVSDIYNDAEDIFYLAQKGIMKNNQLMNDGLTNISHEMEFIKFNGSYYMGDIFGKLWKWALIPSQNERAIAKTSDQNLSLEVRPTISNNYIEASYIIPANEISTLVIINL